jgi:general transcription factor 3C polypeptide 3 (transcription factor C subunit 4)
MALLTRYRKLSAKDETTQEEIEYNYGRAFHGLGKCKHLLMGF